MIYFKKDDTSVSKYLVTIDKERLENTSRDILVNCGTIIYKEVTTDYPGMFLRGKHIISQTSEYVGEREYDCETRSIEKLCVYYIKEPDIYKMIMSLLNEEDTTLIDYLLSNPSIPEYDPYEEINNKLKEIEEVVKAKGNNCYKIISLTEELQLLYKTIDMNKDRKSVNEYIPIISSCINLELIDTIDKETIDKVSNFYEKRKVLNRK